MNRWLFVWLRVSRKLWVRAGAYAFVAIVVAAAAVLARPVIPASFAERFGGDSVEAVLTILASSMLAVTTFSLGAIVTAYTAVSQAATPRVAELVTSDTATQKALSTFVGAFLYAIVGVTAVNAGYYGPEGRAVIFGFSLVVVALVAFRLLSWVSRLSSLARTGHMIELVETRTRDALQRRLEAPFLGGEAKSLEDGMIVRSEKTGYSQNVDCDGLQRFAKELDCYLEILAPPGAFVLATAPLARVSASQLTPEQICKVQDAFDIHHERAFDQDPRFGLIVLGEIAGKALSPGVNDPGTAVQVIGSGVRLLELWSRGTPPPDLERPNLYASPLAELDLIDDIFGPIMRYGAGDAIVSTRLQKALLALAGLPGLVGTAASVKAAEAYARASSELEPKFDLPALQAVRLEG